MLIIGHRGAVGLAPENTIESMSAGIDAGSDMIEFDVRLTKDKQLVVIHDATLSRTHKHRLTIAKLSYEQIKNLTQDKPVPLLSDVLDKFYGKVILNIEIKSRGAGVKTLKLLQTYVRKKSDWDNVIISSFMGNELVRLRTLSKDVNLALLHNRNPFVFVAYHRFVRLTAVGFHRLYLNRFALEIAHRAGLFTYVYTVNRPKSIIHLSQQGIDGVVTNFPDKFVTFLDKESVTNKL